MPKDSKRKRHLRACGKISSENFKKRLKSDQEWITEERNLFGTYEENFALEMMKSYFSEVVLPSIEYLGVDEIDIELDANQPDCRKILGKLETLLKWDVTATGTKSISSRPLKYTEVYWFLLRAKKQKLLCGWS